MGAAVQQHTLSSRGGNPGALGTTVLQDHMGAAQMHSKTSRYKAQCHVLCVVPEHYTWVTD